MIFFGEYHHRSPLLKRKAHISRMSRLLKKAMKQLHLSTKNTSLIGAGISGALLVPALADKHKLSFALIRERWCRPIVQSNNKVVGVVKNNIIFIDDVIDSGRTFKRANALLKKHNREIRLVAIIAEYACSDTRARKISESFQVKVFTDE